VASFDNEVSVPKTKKEEIARLSAALLAVMNAPVPVNPTCKISKSKFMAGLQCAKRGYLQVRHPELASSVDDSKMQQGIEVGSLARQMFAGGVLVAADHRHLSDAIRDTRELVANCEVPVILEAAFEHSGVLVRADVLKRNGKGFHLTEVKSATKIKPEHTDDVSIQKYVMQGCGVQVKDTNVMHLSRDYIYDGAVGADGRRVYDISRLFATEEVQPQSDGQVSRTLDEQFRVLGHPQPPNVEPSSQCNSPYYCEFYDHCHPVWADNDIRSLPIAGCKIEALRDAGITSIDQPPGLIALRERFHLTKKECKFALGAKEKGVQINPALVAELESLHYPLYFMDFETVFPALPLFAGLRPYDQLPFQWSVHVLSKPGTEPEHHEFLAADTNDPRREFISSLCAVMGESGHIVVYNETFESQRLSELTSWPPGFAGRIANIQGRLWDLLPRMRKHVYHPAFAGSFSLKYVLPALVPGMTYEGMEVADGTEAGVAWEKLVRGRSDQVEREKTWKALLDYCGQDTLALVRLVEKLRLRSLSL
jgi:predicted RecB family nuclease